MKNLIREVHRRSLWQVLGIYLAGAWVALQVVEQLTEAAGLPSWVRPFSLVLLVLGFPIVMATAFVQEGMTTKGPEPAPQSLADAGEVPPPPPESPTGHRRILTWRNALLGGLGAFAILGLLTAGYLFMRTSGIGPAGTLVAQGLLDEGVSVVLARFDSPDPDLADVVTLALETDLLQSPTIRVLERSDLSAPLRRMELEEDAAITRDVAHDLASREGYGAVIEGEVRTAGAGYVLAARIVSGADGAALAAFRATARGDEDLIDAIESLSRDIRDKAGESLRTVQSAPPLSRVTTGSLEALELYTRAGSMADGGDEAGAVELYERAIAADPEFAMAHRRVGVMLSNMGVRRADAVHALTRAYELRQRLPEIERYLADGYYHAAVIGDREASNRAYENLLDVAPGNRTALNNLAQNYRAAGRLEEAEALLLRAVEAADFRVAYTNLARVRFELGEDEAGLAALDAGEEAIPGAAWIIENRRVEHALELADYDEAEVLIAGYGERFPSARASAQHANQRALLAGMRGRLSEAEAAFDEMGQVEWVGSHPVIQGEVRARVQALRGDTARAVSTVLAAYAEVSGEAMPATERRYPDLIATLFDLGATDDAERILDEWVREVSPNEPGFERWPARKQMAARAAHARGDYAESVRLWTEYEQACPGTCGLTASLGLAQAHEAQGDVDREIAEYERYLASNRADRAYTDWFERATVLERLGHLYDDRGEAAAAVRYYGMFVDLWADADAELQPRVSAARARLAALEEAA